MPYFSSFCKVFCFAHQIFASIVGTGLAPVRKRGKVRCDLFGRDVARFLGQGQAQSLRYRQTIMRRTQVMTSHTKKLFPHRWLPVSEKPLYQNQDSTFALHQSNFGATTTTGAFDPPARGDEDQSSILVCLVG